MTLTGQIDCLPFVTEKFVILSMLIRIMRQCENAPQIHVSSRNMCFVQKVFQELRNFCERIMIQKNNTKDD